MKIVVDTIGEICPHPLFDAMNVMDKQKKGTVIKIIGDDQKSFNEIPQCLEVLEKEIIEKGQIDKNWYITFKV